MNIQLNLFHSYRLDHKDLYEDILALTQDMQKIYPCYIQWYRHVFLSGLKKGERLYIVALDKDNRLCGCSLIKKTSTEQKICTLFVKSEYRHKGLATQMLTLALSQLDEQPLMTVSNHTLNQVHPLLKKIGFEILYHQKGVYCPNDTEYYFCRPKQSKTFKEKG